MNTHDESPVPPEVKERTQGVSQEEADRFNLDMQVRRLPYRARIDPDPTPHFVVEPPLPPEMIAADYEAIRSDRKKRRATLVDQRNHTADPRTFRRLEMMVDNHDRGTDRIQSHEPERERRKRSRR